MAIILDTHAVIWYLLKSDELSSAASQMIRDATRKGDPAYVPVISLVEVIYLA